MSTTVAEMQEERCKHIGRGNFNGIIISGTIMAAPLAQSQSHAKERPKKEPARPMYRKKDCVSRDNVLNSLPYTVC